MRFVSILVLIPMLLTGCSSLHTEVHPEFDWTVVSTVALQAPEDDRWGMVPVVRQELREMGYAIAPASSPEVQASVKFFWVEAPDLTESGEIVSRPKSLHLQFFAPDGSPVAAADYSPPPSESPERGARVLFNGLKEKLREAPKNADSASPEAPSLAEGEGEREMGAPPDSPGHWAPRLKSWGVDAWGKSRKTE